MAQKIRYSTNVSSRFARLSCQGRQTPFPIICKRSIRCSSQSFTHDPPNSKISSIAGVSKWIKACWDNDKDIPVFAVNGNKINILIQPQEFYQTLKV